MNKSVLQYLTLLSIIILTSYSTIKCAQPFQIQTKGPRIRVRLMYADGRYKGPPEGILLTSHSPSLSSNEIPHYVWIKRDPKKFPRAHWYQYTYAPDATSVNITAIPYQHIALIEERIAGQPLRRSAVLPSPGSPSLNFEIMPEIRIAEPLRPIRREVIPLPPAVEVKKVEILPPPIVVTPPPPVKEVERVEILPPPTVVTPLIPVEEFETVVTPPIPVKEVERVEIIETPIGRLYKVTAKPAPPMISKRRFFDPMEEEPEIKTRTFRFTNLEPAYEWLMKVFLEDTDIPAALKNQVKNLCKRIDQQPGKDFNKYTLKYEIMEKMKAYTEAQREIALLLTDQMIRLAAKADNPSETLKSLLNLLLKATPAQRKTILRLNEAELQERLKQEKRE